jgi:hypothetical protein
MPFRYRLINAADGRDIGPFVSKRDDWKAGDRLGRSKGEDMVVTAVIAPEDDEVPRVLSCRARRG